jgi:hypothetical protein
VLFVCNRAQIKKRFVELAQSRQVVCTDVHVMELEVHRHFLSFGLVSNPLTHVHGITVFCEPRSVPQLWNERYINLPVNSMIHLCKLIGVIPDFFPEKVRNTLFKQSPMDDSIYS